MEGVARHGLLLLGEEAGGNPGWGAPASWRNWPALLPAGLCSVSPACAPTVWPPACAGRLTESRIPRRTPLRMCVLGRRVIGVHKLLVLNFYPYLQKYIQPHQRDVTQILAALVQARAVGARCVCEGWGGWVVEGVGAMLGIH